MATSVDRCAAGARAIAQESRDEWQNLGGPASEADPRVAFMDFSTADPGIRSLIADYFDVMHFQNMELFDRVFHPSCALYSAQGGELSLRPYAVYREQVATRQSPAELGNARRDEVLAFDQVSPTLAWVKPQLEMFGGVMQDYLNLVYLDGQWWVMAKMWEKVADSA
jgi:hypothetical protein